MSCSRPIEHDEEVAPSTPYAQQRPLLVNSHRAQVRHRAHRFAVDADDDITLMEAGARGLAHRLDLRHDDATGDLGGHVELAPELWVEVLQPEAKEGAVLIGGRDLLL